MSNGVSYPLPEITSESPFRVTKGDLCLTHEHVHGDVSSGGTLFLENCVVDRGLECDGELGLIATSCARVLSKSMALIGPQCQVEGDVEAGAYLNLKQSWVGGELRSPGEIHISEGSTVCGDVRAGDAIHISKSSVCGDLSSNEAAIKAEGSRLNATRINALGEVLITASALSEQAQIVSEKEWVEIALDERAPCTVARVAALRWIILKNVSSIEVESTAGRVACSYGNFNKVSTAGSSHFYASKVEKLEIHLLEGQDVYIDLPESEIMDVSIDIRDACGGIPGAVARCTFIGGKILGELTTAPGIETNLLPTSLPGSH
jgi:cytoskeletal protein CcmA (bactofilin family)